MLQEQFKTVRGYISNRKFAELEQFSFSVPKTFNWVREVFEEINCVEFPDREALIWTDDSEVLAETANRKVAATHPYCWASSDLVWNHDHGALRIQGLD